MNVLHRALCVSQCLKYLFISKLFEKKRCNKQNNKWYYVQKTDFSVYREQNDSYAYSGEQTQIAIMLITCNEIQRKFEKMTFLNFEAALRH